MLFIKQSRASHAALKTAVVSLVAFGALHAAPSMAACVTDSATNTTNCDTGSPNPWTSVVGAGPSTANGATLNIAPGAQISTGNANAISLGNNANITLGAGAIVQNNASSGVGLWRTGNNAVEFGSNGVINIAQGAQVLATGTQHNAEAINVMGSGNQIINRGLISSTNASAIWFEDLTVGAANVVDNYGTIRTLAGPNASVIGNGGQGSVTFINRTGARVEGNLSFAGGNDNLTLEAGSVITGNFDGGGGTNTLTLSGREGSSDALLGNILNFQTLTKTGAGLWTLSGAIGANGGATPLSVLVQEGTLALTGNNTKFNGNILVDTAGTLEARAQSLPPIITNNGLVRFAQPDNGSYAGNINGSGAVEKTQAGVLTLTGVNGYTGGTTIKGGTIAIRADNAIGAGNGAITLDGGALSFISSFNLSGTRAISVTANNGTLDTAAGVTSTLSQDITGAGTLSKTGAGTILLTGNNTYAGGTTISGGTLQLGNGGTSGSVTGAINNNGTLAFNRSDAVTLGNLITGTGNVNQIGTGTTVLTANNSYTGATNVDAGALYIYGDQTAATGVTSVANGATLGGTGIIGGTVIVADGGTLSPGSNTGIPGTLTIQKDLSLSSGSILDYNFGQAGVVGGPFNDLTKVGGDLTLGGTLNVQTPPGGSFDTGIYRVISYRGTLTDNGLSIGTIPSPDFHVQTSVDKQVNLVNTNGLTLNYWDGAAGPKNDGHVNGGDGVWQNYNGNDHWTNEGGTPNAPFSDRSFAIFTAAPGTVTVDNSLGNVNVAGMQFASDGYTIQGDAVTLVGNANDTSHSVIRVGDGTSEGAGYTATVNAVLTGNSALVKKDLGTLVLNGTNTYTGGTLINGGTVQVASDANLGDAAGALSFDQGTLRTTTSFDTARAITLNAGGGTLETTGGTQLMLNGTLTGAGSLTKSHAGTVVLTANNNYNGGTTIAGGTLQLGNGGTSGSIVGDVTNNGALNFNRADAVTFNGTIAGSGTLNQIGSGTTQLNAVNTYTGMTTVANGALAIGDAAHASAALNGGGGARVAAGATLGGYGNVSGPVNNQGTIAVADAMPAFTGDAKGSFTIHGALTNAGTAQIAGTGIGNTLKVTSYVGQRANIVLNTFLGGDNAPSDRLVIDGGHASGQSTLRVNQVGGVGDKTPGNGILLVDAINGATTATDAFALGGRVVAGPYEYALHRGGRSGSTPESWYLRSEYPGSDKDDGANVGPDPQPEPDDVRPDYRREVSDYTALSSMMLNFGRATLGTLHERMGEQAQLPSDHGGVDGVWARVIGQNGKWNAKRGGIYNQGPSFDDNFVAVQAGGDLFHEEKADGTRDRAGLYGVVGHSNGSVTHYDGSRAGTNKFDAYSFGGYWTHYGAKNWYVDSVMQGTWYKAKSGSGQLSDLKTDAFGFAASVEAGYPFQLGQRWIVEPQAQLIYQGVSVAQASDGVADVRFGNANSLAGRAGARLARTWALDEGAKPRLVTAWLRGNVWHEFSGNPMTEISSNTGFVPFRSNLKGSWYELSAGANAQLTKTTSIYANFGYQKGFNNGIQAVSGTLGVRVNW